MRNAFIRALMDAAEMDERVWLLTGDLGYSVLEPFEQRFPDRYINVGISEQNMTGIAAGLAMAGKTVVTYSIANFPTLRCLEQLRNDVCYHGLNVKVVAVGGGLAYGSLGYTHHAVEDLAIMRVLPGMTVAAPGDPFETAAVTSSLLEAKGPGYLRLGKAGEACVHEAQPLSRIGEGIRVRAGRDVTLVSTGAILPMVTGAADALAQRGIEAEVLSLPWVSPIVLDTVEAISRNGRVVTIEEHGPGGLFAALAEVGCRAEMRSVRLRTREAGLSGSQDFLRKESGLTLESIVTAATQLVEARMLNRAA